MINAISNSIENKVDVDEIVTDVGKRVYSFTGISTSGVAFLSILDYNTPSSNMDISLTIIAWDKSGAGFKNIGGSQSYISSITVNNGTMNITLSNTYTKIMHLLITSSRFA